MSQESHAQVDGVVGQYRLERRLGTGGFGDVFLARDARTNRQVVLKISHDADARAIERLRKEAGALARLHHPGIVPVLDTGAMEDGRVFLCMAYVDGVSLEQVLQERGRLTVGQALEVGVALLGVLAYVHEAGFIHRDIKPSNILMPHGATSFADVKVTDFGVLGELQRVHRQETTIAGQFFGTPRYMSPEQLFSRPQTRATDVYGVGAVVYELVFGVAPFEREGEQGMAILTRIASGELEFPPDPQVPDGTRGLLRRCLARLPDERFADAGQALVAFRAQQRTLRPGSGAPSDQLVTPAVDATSAQGAGVDHRPARLSAPGRVWLLSGLVVLAVAAGGVYVFMTLGTAVPPSPAMPPPLVHAPQLRGLLAGGALLVLAGALWVGVRRFLARRRSDTGARASALLLGVHTREALSASLALDVDQLMAQCRSIDDRILGRSMAIMLDEYSSAAASNDRQAALMNVVHLLEKLTSRLSPWYVRHEKLVALLISSVAALSGLASIVASMKELFVR